MFSIVKRPFARTDIKNIWRYTYDNWGEEKADDYIRRLELGIQQLINNPKLGKPRESLRIDYRSLHIERHVIYYKIMQSKISIIRILHEKMDVFSIK